MPPVRKLGEAADGVGARLDLGLRPAPRRPELVDRDDPGDAAVAEDRRHDLRREPAVDLAHTVERRVVVGRGAVVLDDLPPGRDLQADRLGAEVDRPLLAQRPDARRERLVGDREGLLAGEVPAQRHTARAAVGEAGPLGSRRSRPGMQPLIIDAHLHVDEIPALGWKLEAARNASAAWTRRGSSAAS